MHARALVLGHGRPGEGPVYEREETDHRHTHGRARAVAGVVGVAAGAVDEPVLEVDDGEDGRGEGERHGEEEHPEF